MMICMLESLLLYRKGHLLVCFPDNYSSPIEHQYYLVLTQGVPPPKYKMSRPTQDPPKKKEKRKSKKNWEGAIFANPPSEDPLVDEPS